MPITVLGRVLGGFMMLLGIAVFALPIGIIATAFATEIHRREFIVTWGMVARVPLFRELDAEEVSAVMQLLHARNAARGDVIMRKGDPASSMYFLVSGEVEVDLGDEKVTLSDGAFFGEVALLRRTRRTATVVATQRSQMLVLEADDFHGLMARRPEIARSIREEARKRMGSGRKAADITPEELAAAEEGTS